VRGLYDRLRSRWPGLEGAIREGGARSSVRLVEDRGDRRGDGGLLRVGWKRDAEHLEPFRLAPEDT
jgi:hypothetical protein